MKKSQLVSLVAIAAVAAFFIFYAPPLGEVPTEAEIATTGPEDARVNAFFQEFIDREIAESPMFQTYLGLKTADQGKWDDVLPSGAFGAGPLRGSLGDGRSPRGSGCTRGGARSDPDYLPRRRCGRQSEKPWPEVKGSSGVSA